MSERGLSYLRNLPDGPDLEPLLEFVNTFDEPESVAEEIRSLLQLNDPLVAPPAEFTQAPSDRLYENWDYPVMARSLFQVSKGRLLCLPPGSERYKDYCETMPKIMKRHREENFPRLKSELANRPNLFFQGVFYPDEITIRNMEMISLHHGRNYVVRCDLKLQGLEQSRTVVLKPTSMGVEAVLTTLIDELNRRMPPNMKDTIGTIQVPEIVAVDDTYGILEYLPGKNGVEVLPGGINTGSIQTLRSNEYPRNFDVSADGLLQLTDEFAKQAALAFYLRLYDRKPDQMMFRKQNGKYNITHIDFGRSIKRNYALPWKRYYATERAPLEFKDHEVPYFEAASSLIFIPHFIPEPLRDRFSPFEGRLRQRLKQCFTTLADFFQRNTDVIRDHLLFLVGEKTQFDDHQVHGISINRNDVEEVSSCLMSFDPSPEEVFDSVLNLARMERKGTTPTESVEETDESIYMRGVRSGNTSRRLQPQYNGDTPYEIKDYKEGGKVFYEPDEQYLFINFGSNPQTIIDYVHWYYSGQLAEFIESFDEIKPGVTVKVYVDGESEIRIPPGLVRTDVQFPPEALREVRQVVKGFAPQHHVGNYIDSFRSWKEDHPKANFRDTEQERQKIIFRNNLEGKEVLQAYLQSEDNDPAVNDSISEIIYHMLSNPDYLVDKDPVKSINNLIVNLGHKHEFIDPLGEDDLPEDETLHETYRQVFQLYNKNLSIGHFPDKTPQHIAHIRIMIELAEIIGREMNLEPSRRRLLMVCVLLHDLNIFNEQLGNLLLNPNGRLDRPIMESFLDEHPEQSIRYFDQFQGDGLLELPQEVDPDETREILRNHHSYRFTRSQEDLAKTELHQILHLLDNFAVFADQSRPDEWDHGFIPLEVLAPRWLDAEYERDHISEEVYESFNQLFTERYESKLNEINDYTTTFLKVFNALQLAASLHYGIDPQNPDLFYELGQRYGADILDKVWSRVTDSTLPVYEKVRIFRRLDDLSSLFPELRDNEFSFINATPRPIQRAVEKMRQCLVKDHLVILMGVFPRVTKAYRRFRKLHSDEYADKLDRIVAICGLRRLHFIRHSYPYEADFEVPFHQIIQQFRNENEIDDELCFIPFEKFFSGYKPTEDPESRVRELEKASELEQHTIPDRVQQESKRFHDWCSRQDNLHLDDIENERFRRIVFNDFTNREVLHFYTETLTDNDSVTEALTEVVGALRENPNYLSERNSRYSIHELVRSLSQIHFFRDDHPRAIDQLEEVLQEWNRSGNQQYISILECNGGEMNFLKDTLVRALKIFGELRPDDKSPPKQAEIYALLTAGVLFKKDALHDFFVSPEDISYNQGLRRRLHSFSKGYLDDLRTLEPFKNLNSEIQRNVISILGECTPPDTFALIQLSLYTAFYLDFGRIENWERGRRRFLPEDREHLLEPMKKILPTFIPEPTVDKILNQFRKRFSGPQFQFFNSLSEETYQYIYLFNALNLTAELRHGLFPGGASSLENVRQLHGAKQVKTIADGIINSSLSVVESLKIFRKIRYLAGALNRHQETPDSIHFLNVDRTGTWSIPDPPSVKDGIFILTGELQNTITFWRQVSRSHPDIKPRTYVLVGEEYPLMIKETSLSMTDYLRESVSEYRTKKNVTGRHLLIPAGDLLRGAPSLNESNKFDPSYERQPESAFFDAWLMLFEQ